MTSNVVSFASGPTPKPLPKAADLLRLEAIDAARTLHRALAAGLLADESPALAARIETQLMLELLCGGIDLDGLCLDKDGKAVAVVAGLAERFAPFDDLVLLQSGEAVRLLSFVTSLLAGCNFLRLPGSTATGLAATIEALRSRVEARPC